MVLILTAAVRWHRLEVPLERDEGEYAYAGQLMLQGVPPYVGAYNMKLPGIYLVYAAVLGLFGETVWAIHLALLLVNLASIAVVFLIGRRLIDELGALTGAATFAVVSLHQSVTGLFANSEHFVVLAMLGGTWLLLKALDRDRLWLWGLAGVLMGAAFVIKQHGIMFIGFGVAVILTTRGTGPAHEWSKVVRREFAYLVGVVFPFLLICIWMAAAGVFARFWFWTFTYASHYVSQVSVPDGIFLLRHQLGAMQGELTGFWLLALIGSAGVLFGPAPRKQSLFWLVWSLASWAAIFPGLFFRNHYFLFVLPVSSLFVGAAISRMTQVAGDNRGRRIGGIVVFAVVLAWAVFGQREVLFTLSNEAVSRRVYGDNPFPESLAIADYIQRHSTHEDTIAVIGSEPEIYFYSCRRSATGHIYTYALMEEHPFAREMQREMISQIEAAQPRFLVFVNVRRSWLTRPNSFRDLLEWTPAYLAANYEMTGLVQILPTGTVSLWDTAAKGHEVPRSEGSWLGVYRRKEN